MTTIAKVVEKLVATYSEEKKAEVSNWILQLGIRSDDPLFNLGYQLKAGQNFAHSEAQTLAGWNLIPVGFPALS